MLVSTTLAGPDARHQIADALASVPWVDRCLLILTGKPADSAELVAAARAVAGDRLVVREWPWRRDFSAARNAALALAAELGATWAVTLDTDERLVVDGEAFRACLRHTDAPAVLLAHEDGSYAKPRAIRLPAPVRWVGRTHEAITLQGPTALGGFRELGKTTEQLRAKFARDAEILEGETKRAPSDPRWWYYLGDAYAGLTRWTDAVLAFRRCADLRGWDEESAWACYRAAEILTEVLDRHDQAVDECARGLARHAGIAELAWMAALASARAGRPHQARDWARLAEVHREGSAAAGERIGFRCGKGLREGPADVLRFALRQLGDAAGADAAERRFREVSP